MVVQMLRNIETVEEQFVTYRFSFIVSMSSSVLNAFNLRFLL